MSAKVLTPEAAIENGQGSLFEPNPVVPTAEIPLDPSSQLPDPFVGNDSEPTYVSADGPTVNLIDRAEQLKIVTDKLAQINRTRGLAEVLETSQGQRVQRRYGGDAQHVQYRAEALHKRRMIDAKEAFAKASGMYAMIESGVMTESEAKKATHDDWIDFMKRYADANQPNRVALRQQQNRLVRKLTKPAKK